MARVAHVRRNQREYENEAIDDMLGEPENVYAQASQRLKPGVTLPEPSGAPISAVSGSIGNINPTSVPGAAMSRTPSGGGGGSTSSALNDTPDLGGLATTKTGAPNATPTGPVSTTQPVGPRVGPIGSNPYDPALDGPLSDYGPQVEQEAPPAAAPSGADLQWGSQEMPGFNTAEWGPGGDPNYDENSPKNNFGKIASRYAKKPSSLKLIAADKDFQALFPGAHFDEKDHLIMPDGSVVDVLTAADSGTDTATGWAWQPLNESGAGGADTANAFGSAASATGGNVPGVTDDNTLLAQIMASVDAMAKGNEDPLVKQQIDKLLAQASPQLQSQLNTALSGTTQGRSSTVPAPSNTKRVGVGGVR
jgi:hypothetical protein